jgi:ribosomal protein S13
VARIAGVDVPNNKRIEVGLTYIYGIGRSQSKKILAQASVNPETQAKDLTDEETTRLRDIIASQFHVEGDLRSPREGSADLHQRPHAQGPPAHRGGQTQEGIAR